ncbi:MAG: hypothetical protein SFW09_14195 [Hyphomicrobiaceae bacterium]|nr:hypothetical protein [Hyphomicrobiaceae bacterium]
MPRFLTAFVLLLSLAAAASPAQARSHIALVVDNAASLGGGATASRARDIATALERMSYTVRMSQGTDAAGLRQLIQAFRTDTKESEVALFYYRGPALSAGGHNLLVPRGTPAGRPLDETAIAMAEIEAAMTASKANVVLLDPSTDDAALETLVRQQPDRSLALAAFAPQPRFLIASAAIPGQPRHDRASAFSEALAVELANPDFNWGTLAQNLRWQTFQRSRGAQVPMILNRLESAVQVAALGSDAVAPGLPGRALSPTERRAFIVQVQNELKQRSCHSGDPDGDAATAGRGLAELLRTRNDAPRLDLASATPAEYEAWLEWLRGTNGQLCEPASPPVRAKRPIAKPQVEAPPAKTQRAERPVQRRVERQDPPPRSPPVVRREPSGGGGGRSSGGGSGGGSIRIPSF